MRAADASPASAELRDAFGEIDIYLFDQLLRGRFDRRRRVLDAGCGGGRNLPYLLRRGFAVRAVDADAAAIAAVRASGRNALSGFARRTIFVAPRSARCRGRTPRPTRSSAAPSCTSLATKEGVCGDAPGDVAGARAWRVGFSLGLATSIGIERHL